MKYIHDIYICKFQRCYDILENMYMRGEAEMEYLGKSESTSNRNGESSHFPKFALACQLCRSLTLWSGTEIWLTLILICNGFCDNRFKEMEKYEMNVLLGKCI